MFATPLLDSRQAQALLSYREDAYFDFLSVDPVLQPNHGSTLSILRAAIHQTCDLYLLAQTTNASSSLRPDKDDVSFAMLERLRQLVMPINAETPGAHALVWSYFIAAAESRSLQHRQFFSKRLRELHHVGRFGNILIALQTLEQIWMLEPGRRWTDERELIAPVLIV